MYSILCFYFKISNLKLSVLVNHIILIFRIFHNHIDLIIKTIWGWRNVIFLWTGKAALELHVFKKSGCSFQAKWIFYIFHSPQDYSSCKALLNAAIRSLGLANNHSAKIKRNCWNFVFRKIACLNGVLYFSGCWTLVCFLHWEMGKSVILKNVFQFLLF